MKHERYIIIAVVVLVVGQAGFDFYLYRQSLQPRDSTIVSLLVKAVDGLYKPAPVDARTGNSYLPEAHLFVPAGKNDQTLLYNYVDVDNQPRISITSHQLINGAESKVWSVQRFTVTSKTTTWYAYTEPICTSPIEPLIAQLKNIQAY